jgi:N-methyl-L-proline demethylase
MSGVPRSRSCATRTAACAPSTTSAAIAARGCSTPGAAPWAAGAEPGVQVRLTANLKRRREILGIVDWRVTECERLGVEIRCNVFAEADDVLAERPDIVVIATGGLPNTTFLAEGEELATTSWDILSSAAKPGAQVILYDDNGAHPGLTVGEFIAASGSALEIVTPERALAPDVGGTSYPPYFKAFSEHGVAITLNLRLTALRRAGNRLTAVFHDEYAKRTIEKRADQVVIETGTLPLDALYFDLLDRSVNLGEVDHAALLSDRPQTVARNPDGAFRLWRIGDAVAGRNIHAAVYDALRLMKDT